MKNPVRWLMSLFCLLFLTALPASAIPKPAGRDGTLIWHGHSSQIDGSETGYWKSMQIGTQTPICPYSPVGVTATFERVSVRHIYRFPSLFGPNPAWYYTQDSYEGFIASTGAYSDAASRAEIFDFNEEEDETWLSGADTSWPFYQYWTTQTAWIVRVTLSTPWPNIPTLPTPTPATGVSGGVSALEIYIKASYLSSAVTKQICFSPGARVIDIEINPGNTSNPATVVREWSGTPTYAIRQYFDDLQPHTPTWSGNPAPALS